MYYVRIYSIMFLKKVNEFSLSILKKLNIQDNDNRVNQRCNKGEDSEESLLGSGRQTETFNLILIIVEHLQIFKFAV